MIYFARFSFDPVVSQIICHAHARSKTKEVHFMTLESIKNSLAGLCAIHLIHCCLKHGHRFNLIQTRYTQLSTPLQG